VTAHALLVPDCGPGVGLGHLERMLALADALSPDPTATVVVPAGDAALRRRVTERGHDAAEADGDAVARALTIAAHMTADVIVLDGYGFGVATQERIRERAPLVVVDDLGHPTACDIAVNPSPGGESKPPDGAGAFLGGAAYALLSPAVVTARAANAGRQPGDGRSVLVTTGAMDPQQLTPRVVEELLARDPVVEVVAIVGPEMDARALREDLRLHVLVEPPTLADAMAAATVYAGAAGTSAVQAACIGVPAVISVVAANQRDQATALAAAGCAVVANPEEVATVCLRLLDDAPRCTRMRRAGRELVDGDGAARVADSIRRLVRIPAV